MIDISIIIPTLNRGPALTQALSSIAKVVGSSDQVEIVIVDNGSSDRTGDVCREIAQRFPTLEWRYFYDDMPGLLTGRHRGAKEARGEILAYLDDDILLSPSWLEALKGAFSDPSIALAGGPSTPLYEVNPPSWLAGFWQDEENGRHCIPLSLYDGGNAIKPVDPLYIWGLNFCIRKQVFESCGGFHPDSVPKRLQRYQGDGETGLSSKIKAKGLFGLYHPGLAVTHVVPGSRLTPEYFEQRYYFQGVCDSFTRIRSQGGVDERRDESWKAIVRPLKRRLHRAFLIRRMTVASVRQLVGRAYMAGYAFHQDEVRADPTLLEWILKADYFDYRLPSGWETYRDRESAHQ